MSVRQVWRETAALFWEYPLLWLPVLGADLLSFLLIRAQKFVTHELINHLLLPPASVFGGGQSLPESSWRALTLKAATLGAPFLWGTYFLATVLYTTALFMTAAFVRDIKQSQRCDFRLALEFAGRRRRLIVRFSLMMLGLFVLAALIFAITPQIGDRPLALTSPAAFAYGYTAMACICIAYWMSPVAMRRISAEGPRPLTEQSRSASRIFAIPIALASLLLAGLLPYLERSLAAEHLLKNFLARSALEVVLSLVSALPYVVLFIALTLIADGGLSAADLADLSDRGDGTVQVS
jgi:hypothetical protein